MSWCVSMIKTSVLNGGLKGSDLNPGWDDIFHNKFFIIWNNWKGCVLASKIKSNNRFKVVCRLTVSTKSCALDWQIIEYYF